MAIRKSRQQLIDEKMCKPGYTWNETLGRCLGAGGGYREKPDEPGETPDGAVRQEITKRMNGDAQAVEQPATLPIQ